VPAELAGQRPLLERAAAGDREAFAQLYDTQVDGIYRYLLAWTADPGQAATLTAEVFHGAFSWLTVTHTADTEAAAWLTAMARDAVVQRRGPAAAPSAPDPVAAVAHLSDPKREVLVLRLLCGHSLAHTAHLSGFTGRAVLELQLSACQTISELTSGTPAPPPQESDADEFEHHLTEQTPDPSSTPPTLAGALAVARSLRQAAPGYVAGPDPDLLERLRQSLLTGELFDPSSVPAHLATRTHQARPADPGAPPTDPEAGPTHPVPDAAPRTRAPEPPAALGPPGPRGSGGSGARRNLAPRSRGPRIGRVAGLEAWWARLSTGLAEARLLRRPWLATGVATAGIVVVLTLQAFGDPAPTGACGGRPCPATTTVAAVAAAGPGSSLGTSQTTVLQPSTTTSTVAAPTSPPPAPRTSASTTPPTTRPATTAPPTTARPTTTTRAPTTTAPPTTLPTTTTAAPAPAPT
jgi:DNA-directed RNA polymerase specialized sigma24 family protein